MDQADARVVDIGSTVAALVDRLRASIDDLRQLHDRWKDGHDAFLNLIAQLTALKASLGHMHDWIVYALGDLHAQLLRDLDYLTASCALLAQHLAALVARLRQPAHDGADWALRARLALAARSMLRLQKAAARQTDAINLLLAACRCHTQAQRKILLHKSRQIRQTDASTVASLLSPSHLDNHCIDAMTHLSRAMHWVRCLLAPRRLLPDASPAAAADAADARYLDAAAAMRSQAIDRKLQLDASSLRRECKVLLMGDAAGGRDLMMRQLRLLFTTGYSAHERAAQRRAVRWTVRRLVHAVVDLIKDAGLVLGPGLDRHLAVLLHEMDATHPDDMTPDAARALDALWRSNTFGAVFVANVEIDFPDHASYFARHVARIAAPDYLPTDGDMVRLTTLHPAHGVHELRCAWGELDAHVLNVRSIPPVLRKRWMHQFESPAALVFAVDIAAYDVPLAGADARQSRLLEAFVAFESAVNAPLFAGSAVVLVLNNFARFKAKLQHAPLSQFFADFGPTPKPDADGAPDTSSDDAAVAAARNYLLERFKQLNRNRLDIYSFWVDLDMSDNARFYAALKKTLSHIQNLRPWDARSSATHSSSPSNKTLVGSPTSPATASFQSKSTLTAVA